MAVNNLTYEQSYAFLTALYEEATGQQGTLQVADTGTFTTVAQAVLKTGYDNIINSISQVLSRTIFSVRPYSAKFRGIDVDAQRWGAITRKINYIDTPIRQDDKMNLVDGSDMASPWLVQKPAVLQTNFYGHTVYAKAITILKDQLDVAFSNADEFGRFISGLMQNVSDQLEQIREAEARGVLVNFMTGKYTGDAGNCINVLQEYYNETGTTLTVGTMFAPANYPDFVKWLYAYVNTLTEFMSERTTKYHINVTGKELMRHTPANRMKAFMLSDVQNKIDATVLSSVFNPERLKMIDWESVNFWQNIDNPYSVLATPTYMLNDGTLDTAVSPVGIDCVLGVLFDEDALGITTASTWMQASPMNARTGAYTIWYHFTQRTWNDFTENGVILYADTVTP